jgi:Leucine-rich repeat (LRR) protein
VVNTPIAKLPKALENAAESLTVLILTGTGLIHVNDVVFTLRRLSHLEISDCKIRAVPDKFDRLPALHQLDLSRNGLTEVPASIIRHCNLASLSLRDNKIETLPSLPWNTFMVYVDLGGNPITGLPPSYNTNCVWPASMRAKIWQNGPSKQPRLDVADVDEAR